MSAPHTNLEKQRRRHWVPLLGILITAIFGVGIILYWVGEEVATSDPRAPAGLDAGTVNEPAQSTIPAEVIEPDTAAGGAEAPPQEPSERESPPVPNQPSELTTE